MRRWPRRFSYSPRFNARPAGDAPSTGRVRHALGGCPHQRHHLSSAPAADGSPRHQGRRGAQRPDHRIVVRPLVPPSPRARESVSSAARPPPRASRVRTTAAAPPPIPGASRRWPTAREWRRTTWSSPSTPQRPNESPSRCASGGTGGTVVELDGFATSVPPPDSPLQPDATRPPDRRDPYAHGRDGKGALGPVPDAGRYPVLLRHGVPAASRAHVLLGHGVGTVVDQPARPMGEDDRSSIATATSRCSRSMSATSTPLPSHLKDEFGRGKAARDCTADEIAAEVWRQIVDRPHEQRRQRRRGTTAVAGLVRDRPRSDHGGWSRAGCRPSRAERDPVPGADRRGLA